MNLQQEVEAKVLDNHLRSIIEKNLQIGWYRDKAEKETDEKIKAQHMAKASQLELERDTNQSFIDYLKAIHS